jgi:SseB protein N-terminal domain
VRNTLHLLLLQFAQGDQKAWNTLYRRLAECLVVVPSKVREDDTVKVSLQRLSIRGKTFVPVFTGRSFYKEWLGTKKTTFETIEILLGDFCDALDVHTSLLIDAGSEHEVMLSPEQVDYIAATSVTPKKVETTTNILPSDIFSEDAPLFTRKGGEGHTLGRSAAVSTLPNIRSRVQPENLNGVARAHRSPVVFHRSELFDRIALTESDRPDRESLKSFSQKGR